MWKSKQTSPSVVDSKVAACIKKQTNKVEGEKKSSAKFANWLTENRAPSCALKEMPFLYAWNHLYRTAHPSSSALMGKESELSEEPAVAPRKKLPVMQLLPMHPQTAVSPARRGDFVSFALNLHIFLLTWKRQLACFLKDAPAIQYLRNSDHLIKYLNLNLAQLV